MDFEFLLSDLSESFNGISCCPFTALRHFIKIIIVINLLKLIKDQDHVRKYCLRASTKIAWEHERMKQTTKNLPRPYFSLPLSKVYISMKIKKRLTMPETARKTHLSHSRGTTLSTVVIMKIVKE